MPIKKKMVVKGGRLFHGGPRPAAPYAAPPPPPVAAAVPVRKPFTGRECPPNAENLFKVYDAVSKKDQ